MITVLAKCPLNCVTGGPHFYFPYINIFISLSPALTINSYSAFALQILKQKRHFPLLFFFPLKGIHTYTPTYTSTLLSPANCYYMLSISLHYPGYSVLCSLCYFLWIASSSLRRRAVFYLPRSTLVHTALI